MCDLKDQFDLSDVRDGNLPVIVVHGGAWRVPDHLEAASRAGVKVAVQTGYKIMEDGGSAVDAVTAAIKVLEDDAAFDAGRGSVLTDTGNVEMDALIMDGRSLECGSVAAVGTVKNPVMLARTVMEHTPHTMLVAKGASQLAEQHRLETADMDYLITKAGRQEWETYKQYNHTVSDLFSQRTQSGHDTVGAVAIDKVLHNKPVRWVKVLDIA